jgi:hypothetical protein
VSRDLIDPALAAGSVARRDAQAGYRRRILILPGPGASTAELEDDYHRMAVTIQFADGVITAIDSAMNRSPWTTCPGAIAQLEATFLGKALDAAVLREEKPLNCTHLFDLASFAAHHAGELNPVAYAIEVADPVESKGEARLWRDGVQLFHWTYTDGVFSAPVAMAGMPMSAIGSWIAALPADLREPARILRWAMVVARGRMFDLPGGLSAARFASGACYTFQPGRAEVATRHPGAAIDFGALGSEPLEDRGNMFAPRADGEG